MENIDKYIGILHKFNGRDYDGCDCLGLCSLFYKEHGWEQTFDDGRLITKNWEKREPFRLARYLNGHFTRENNYEKLQFGDIILFDVLGDSHLGIYLEYGKVLAMQVPTIEGKTSSTIYHRDFWQKGFKAGYKR